MCSLLTNTPRDVLDKHKSNDSLDNAQTQMDKTRRTFEWLLALQLSRI